MMCKRCRESKAESRPDTGKTIGRIRGCLTGPVQPDVGGALYYIDALEAMQRGWCVPCVQKEHT